MAIVKPIGKREKYASVDVDLKKQFANKLVNDPAFAKQMRSLFGGNQNADYSDPARALQIAQQIIDFTNQQKDNPTRGNFGGIIDAVNNFRTSAPNDPLANKSYSTDKPMYWNTKKPDQATIDRVRASGQEIVQTEQGEWKSRPIQGATQTTQQATPQMLSSVQSFTKPVLRTEATIGTPELSTFNRTNSPSLNTYTSSTNSTNSSSMANLSKYQFLQMYGRSGDPSYGEMMWNKYITNSWTPTGQQQYNPSEGSSSSGSSSGTGSGSSGSSSSGGSSSSSVPNFTSAQQLADYVKANGITNLQSQSWWANSPYKQQAWSIISGTSSSSSSGSGSNTGDNGYGNTTPTPTPTPGSTTSPSGNQNMGMVDGRIVIKKPDGTILIQGGSDGDTGGWMPLTQYQQDKANGITHNQWTPGNAMGNIDINASATTGAYKPYTAPTTNDLQGQLKDYDQLAQRYNSTNMQPMADSLLGGYNASKGYYDKAYGDVNATEGRANTALNDYKQQASGVWGEQKNIAGDIYGRGNKQLDTDVNAQNAQRFANEQGAMNQMTRANTDAMDLARVGLGRLGALNNTSQGGVSLANLEQRGAQNMGDLRQQYGAQQLQQNAQALGARNNLTDIYQNRMSGIGTGQLATNQDIYGKSVDNMNNYLGQRSNINNALAGNELNRGKDLSALQQDFYNRARAIEASKLSAEEQARLNDRNFYNTDRQFQATQDQTNWERARDQATLEYNLQKPYYAPSNYTNSYSDYTYDPNSLFS